MCAWREREGERVSGKKMRVNKQKKRVCGKELHFKLCVIQRERERERACLCVCECMRERERERVCMCVCEYMRERERERERAIEKRDEARFENLAPGV